LDHDPSDLRVLGEVGIGSGLIALGRVEVKAVDLRVLGSLVAERLRRIAGRRQGLTVDGARAKVVGLAWLTDPGGAFGPSDLWPNHRGRREDGGKAAQRKPVPGPYESLHDLTPHETDNSCTRRGRDPSVAPSLTKKEIWVIKEGENKEIKERTEIKKREGNQQNETKQDQKKRKTEKCRMTKHDNSQKQNKKHKKKQIESENPKTGKNKNTKSQTQREAQT